MQINNQWILWKIAELLINYMNLYIKYLIWSQHFLWIKLQKLPTIFVMLVYPDKEYETTC